MRKKHTKFYAQHMTNQNDDDCDDIRLEVNDVMCDSSEPSMDNVAPVYRHNSCERPYDVDQHQISSLFVQNLVSDKIFKNHFSAEIHSRGNDTSSVKSWIFKKK